VSKRFLLAFETALKPPPVWLMRQAGRYLPEYRALRAEAGGFLDLVYNPSLAAEITLQPIKRFGFDAAILFSDILVVPHALGCGLRFAEGEGPILETIRDDEALEGLSLGGVSEKFEAVWRTVEGVKNKLPANTALIGFAGAPWTVASYMLEGGSSRDFAVAKRIMWRDPVFFDNLIDLLVEATIAYLDGQVRAGADALQLFDSWAGALPESEFRAWSIEPTKQIVAGIKAKHPKIPVIGFPRGAGPMLESYARETGVDGVSVDSSVPLSIMRALQKQVLVQGNLDPILLVAGGEPLRQAARRLVDGLSGGRHIFNLGHGIVPETPTDHVAALLDEVRAL